MQVYDFELVAPDLESDYFQFKLVANEQGVIFHPCSIEHRDVGRPGIKYADNYAGNALAAMVNSGVIEFRFHQGFSDARVREIAVQIVEHPKLGALADFTVKYQNRTLIYHS